MRWAIEKGFRFRNWFCLVVVMGFFLGCLTKADKPDTFTLPPKFVDSLSGYDSVQILLKDSSGQFLDTLFHGKVYIASQLVDLPAPHSNGEFMLITLVGYKDGKVAYLVDRTFNGKTNQVEIHRPLILPVTLVKFSVSSLQIKSKTALPFPVVTISPPDLMDKTLLWSSSNTQVLGIESGALRGFSPGTANLHVILKSDTSKHDDLLITVVSNPKVPDSLKLSPDTLKLAAKGQSGRFSVQVYPGTASTRVTWRITDTTLANVSADGALHGLKKGTTMVRAISTEDETLSNTAWLAVSDPVPVERVQFLKNAVDLFVGGAADSLMVQVSPAVANPEVIFIVRDSSIARIQNGRVQGLKVGHSYVVATSFDNPAKLDSLQLTVFQTQYVDSLRLKPDTLRLYIGGESKFLEAKVYPSTVPPLIQWLSNSPSIAEVDDTGKVHPVAAGKSLVTATSRFDSTKKAGTLVIVKKDVPHVFVGRDTVVSLGQTVAFLPVVTQEYGLVAKFKWDLDGDGKWDDSSASLKSVSYKFDQEKEYVLSFYVRDTEGNDTTVMKMVRAVTGPAVLILSPLDNSYTTQAVINISWSVNGKEQDSLLKEILKVGTNILTRTAKDLAGKSYSTQITVYLDTVAPEKPILSGPSTTNTLLPTWKWTGGGGGNGTYRYRLDSQDMSSAPEIRDTTFTSATNLSEDIHTLFVQERDVAGNWSQTGHMAIRLDITPPGIPSVNKNQTSPTNIPRPTWTWTSTGGGNLKFRFKLDSKLFSVSESGSAADTYIPSADLTDGIHTLYVEESDSAGNWSKPGSTSVTVDLTKPYAPILNLSPASPTNNPIPSWTWITGGNGGKGWFRYKLDDTTLTIGSNTSAGTAFAPASPGLAEGLHTFYLQEQDSAGNWSLTSSKSVRIDFTPPATPKVAALSMHASNPKPKWFWSSDRSNGGGGFRYKLDNATLELGGTLTTDTTYTSFGDLSIGSHTLYVEEKDSAGNWSSPGFMAIHVHGQTGYAVGYGGTILKTSDGGANWRYIPSDYGTALNSVFFLDTQIGYVVGYSGTILQTTSGGSQWDTIKSGTVNDLNSGNL